MNRKFHKCSTNGFLFVFSKGKFLFNASPKWSTIKSGHFSKMDEIEKPDISVCQHHIQKKLLSHVYTTKAKHDFQSKSGHFHCSIPNVFVWTRIIIFFGRMKNTVMYVNKITLIIFLQNKKKNFLRNLLLFCSQRILQPWPLIFPFWTFNFPLCLKIFVCQI